MQAPQPRRAFGVAPEPLEVAAHIARVEHVGRHHAELARAGLPAQHVVIAGGRARALERGLGRVVDLVPGRVGPDPREPRVKRPEYLAIRARARRATRRPRRVVPRGEAPAACGKGHQDVLARGAGACHVMVDLVTLVTVLGVVPRDQVAHPPEPQRLPRRALEHGRLLLTDTNAVLGARRSRPDHGQPGNNDHASGDNGKDDSFQRGWASRGKQCVLLVGSPGAFWFWTGLSNQKGGASPQGAPRPVIPARWRPCPSASTHINPTRSRRYRESRSCGTAGPPPPSQAARVTSSVPAPIGTSAELTEGSASTSARNASTSPAWEITLSTTSSPGLASVRSRSGHQRV